MEIRELIAAIFEKHKANGIDINPPAPEDQIQRFEKQVGFALPNDFKEFYSICNGFGCVEDIFNIIPLEQISDLGRDYGKSWFLFSEYMIFSDAWGLRFTHSGEYEIYNASLPALVLTSSLQVFLEHFLEGDVFERNGLYEWRDTVQSQQGAANTNLPK